MKTIREIIQFSESVESAVVELEAREKERDAAEQERVKSALKEWVSQALKGYVTIGSVLDAVYPPPPPPEPAKLKAGYYWYREPGMEGWLGASWIYDFTPKASIEYRPWNDPPPEVTGNTEPTLPTFEEWCTSQGDDLSNWNQPIWTWWSDGDNLGRRLPKDLFDAIDGDVENYSVWRAKNLRDNKKARAALKAALLKLGRIRE